jgi:hypothetical protein
MRDAIAHSSLKFKTIQKAGEHAPPGGFLIDNHLNGRIFSVSWEKKVISYELHQAALDSLMSIYLIVWTEFQKAEEASYEAVRALIAAEALSKRSGRQP